MTFRNTVKTSKGTISIFSLDGSYTKEFVQHTGLPYNQRGTVWKSYQKGVWKQLTLSQLPPLDIPLAIKWEEKSLFQAMRQSLFEEIIGIELNWFELSDTSLLMGFYRCEEMVGKELTIGRIKSIINTRKVLKLPRIKENLKRVDLKSYKELRFYLLY